jgi:DNA polymerase-3 subunit gamma/tau
VESVPITREEEQKYTEPMVTEPQEQAPEQDEQAELLASSSASPAPAMVSEPARKIEIKSPSKRVSGLSLSSIKAKKKHELNKIEVTYDEDSLPSDPFTLDALRNHWENYVQKIDEEGKKILASNLSADLPKVKENTISIELPNDTMKKEVEREQSSLLNYLKSALNNYYLELSISVNEESVRKYAFTPEEKYEKLREKNPAIDLLRKTFDLDL